MSKMNDTYDYISCKAEHIALFSRISSRMLNAPSEKEFIEDTLKDIGEVLQFSRTYIFKVIDELWSITHEWVQDGIISNKKKFQNVDLKDLQEEGGLLHTLSNGQPFIASDVNSIPHASTRKILQKANVAAIITIPLFKQGKTTGMFGVDICNTTFSSAQEITNTIIILGNLINNAKNYFLTQQILKQKKEQVHSLLDAFPFPIYISRMDNYSLLYYNKAIRDLFNLEKLSQLPCHKLFQNLDEPCPFCTNDQLKKDEPPYVWHHQNLLTNHHYKIIDFCMQWEHVENARISIALDITDSLQLQREQVLEHEANLSKGIFLAHMSHELRTPLNGIMGMTHLASKANEDKVIQQYLNNIDISSNKLLAIINDILNFSKNENETLPLDCSSFNFTELIFEVKAILQPTVEKKGIQLYCSVDENIPQLLQGDSLRLSQIILNLTNNAIKFTQKGNVHLDICARGIKNDKQSIDIIVADTGIGIAKDKLDNVFTEYTQADKSTTRTYGGTGLGLAIVKRLVERMGGTISVKSTLNKGSTFTCSIEFDIDAKDKVLQDDNTTQTPIAEDENIEGVRILLVEDNEINTLIAMELLQQYGCIVDTAGDGLIALEKLEINNYDIILMDIQMPNMDGLEATQKIRTVTEFDSIPIVAMSAHALAQDQQKSKAAGMQEHITKPFDPANLRSVIYQYTHKPFIFTY